MTLPLLVATMVVAGGVGVLGQRRFGVRAETASRGAMKLLLTWVLPPVYLVLVSRLHVDGRLLGGIATAYVVIGIVATLGWFVASRVLHLPRRTVGAVVLAVMLANTGYFGLPFTRTLLGGDALGPAVAWDSLVSGPMFFAVAFGVGAAFGSPSGGEGESRLRALLANPLLWASVAGLVLPFDAPDVAATIAQDVVVAILPVGLIVVGVQLAAEATAPEEEDGPTTVSRATALRRLAPDRVVLAVVGLRLVVAPALVVGASVVALDLPPGMLLQAAAPTGLNGLLVAHRFGLDLRPIAASIAWTTLLVTLGAVVATAV